MFLGAISGGVGLILRPVLIFLGFPAVTVIASAPVAGLIGELPGLYVLYKKKFFRFRESFILALPVVKGTVLASVFIVFFSSEEVVESILGWVLLAVAVFIFFTPSFGMHKKKTSPAFWKKPVALFSTAVISAIGTFTGGVGALYNLLYIWLFGKTYISSSALWRSAAYIGLVGSSIVFLFSGLVDFWLFIALSLGLGLGSYFGTLFGLMEGEQWVRIIIFIGVLLSAISLLLL